MQLLQLKLNMCEEDKGFDLKPGTKKHLSAARCSILPTVAGPAVPKTTEMDERIGSGVL